MIFPTRHGSHVAIPTLEPNSLDCEVILSPLYHFAEKLAWDGGIYKWSPWFPQVPPSSRRRQGMGCGRAVCTEGRCEWLCGGQLSVGGSVSLCRVSAHVCEGVAWLRMSLQSERGVSRVSECVHMWCEPVTNVLLWWTSLFFVFRAQSLWAQTLGMRRPKRPPLVDCLGMAIKQTL